MIIWNEYTPEYLERREHPNPMVLLVNIEVSGMFEGRTKLSPLPAATINGVTKVL
jgi:hypothetical protein